MTTSPFAPPASQDAPRQEPNLAPGVTMPPAIRSDRTRAMGLAETSSERNSTARRPLGNDAGPNAGFAFTLAGRASAGWILGPTEHRHDAVAVVAELAIRRAKSQRRAPTMSDVAFAERLLGYRDSTTELHEWRPAVVEGAAHHYQHRRFVVDTIPEELMCLRADELDERLAVFWRSIRVGAGRRDVH